MRFPHPLVIIRDCETHVRFLTRSCFPSVFDALIIQKAAERFDHLGDLPSWFPPPGLSQETDLPPEQPLDRSFFLQHFLHEAQEWWESGKTGQWKSGLWSEPALFGEDVVLEATAVRHRTLRYVIRNALDPISFLSSPCCKRHVKNSFHIVRLSTNMNARKPNSAVA